MVDYYYKYDGGTDGSSATYSMLYIDQNFAPINHVHDRRYYTKTELSTPTLAKVHWNNLIGTPDFSPSGLSVSHNHDSRYFTKQETFGYITEYMNSVIVSDLSTYYVRTGPPSTPGLDQTVYGEKSFFNNCEFSDELLIQNKLTVNDTTDTIDLIVQNNKLTFGASTIGTSAEIYYRGEETVITTNISAGLVLSRGTEEFRIITVKELAKINPVGEITAFAGPITSTFWLNCDGGYYSPSGSNGYPYLFEAIGYTYGISGSLFRVPDLRNRFIYGEGAYSIGQTGGSETHTLTINEMPNHTHETYSFHDDTLAIGGVGYKPDGNGSVNTLATGGDQPHNNMPPYIVLKYMIRARI